MTRRGPRRIGLPGSGCVSVAALALLTVGGAAHAAPRSCPLEIVGIWQSADAEQRTLLSFSAEGWANVLGGSLPQRADDLDIVAQVRYELLTPRMPERIGFSVRRGNDVFPPGNTFWEIAAYDDENFVARASDTERRWTRVQTHRYFLTFAHRAESPAEQPAAAFAMWAALDGRRIAVEAFGVHSRGGDGAPQFGEVPTELAASVVARSRESDVVLRIEIGAAEYLRSRTTLEAWKTLAANHMLAPDDPYRMALDFLATIVESVNRCRVRLKVEERSMDARNDGQARRQLTEVLRALRDENAAAHVGDAVFPAKWSPPPLAL